MRRAKRLRNLACYLGLTVLTLLASCQDPGTSSQSKQIAALQAKTANLDKQIKLLNADKAALQLRIDHDAGRAAAFRRLEFLGSRPALPGPTVTFEILATSKTPNPRESDYPDCIVVSHCAMRGPNGEKTGLSALVAMTVFHNRRLTRAASFKAGMRIRSQLAPWDEMPATVKTIQRVDETDLYDLPLFAAIAPEEDYAIKEVTTTPPSRGNPSQAQAIQASIEAIKTRLAPHGTFEQWHQELRPVRDQLYAKIQAANGPIRKDRRFLIRNLHYINHTPSEQWPAPQIAYFTNLRDQLAAMNIDLIVAPFPEQEVIVSLQFLATPPADGIVFAHREQWLLELLEAGIEVVDLRPGIVAATNEHKHVFYDARDGHPADGAIVAAAHEIAKRLRRYDDVDVTFRKMRTRVIAHSIPARHKKFPPHAYIERCYESTAVMTDRGLPFPRSTPDAPFLLVGDSFIGAPYGYGIRNADLAAHLTKETGVLMRRLEVGGSAPQLMVHIAREGRELTTGVRALIYVFREDYMFKHDPDTAKYRWQIVELPK